MSAGPLEAGYEDRRTAPIRTSQKEPDGRYKLSDTLAYVSILSGSIAKWGPQAFNFVKMITPHYDAIMMQEHHLDAVISRS